MSSGQQSHPFLLGTGAGTRWLLLCPLHEGTLAAVGTRQKVKNWIGPLRPPPHWDSVPLDQVDPRKSTCSPVMDKTLCTGLVGGGPNLQVTPRSPGQSPTAMTVGGPLRHTARVPGGVSIGTPLLGGQVSLACCLCPEPCRQGCTRVDPRKCGKSAATVTGSRRPSRSEASRRSGCGGRALQGPRAPLGNPAAPSQDPRPRVHVPAGRMAPDQMLLIDAYRASASPNHKEQHTRRGGAGQGSRAQVRAVRAEHAETPRAPHPHRLVVDFDIETFVACSNSPDTHGNIHNDPRTFRAMFIPPTRSVMACVN